MPSVGVKGGLSGDVSSVLPLNLDSGHQQFFCYQFPLHVVISYIKSFMTVIYRSHCVFSRVDFLNGLNSKERH